MTRRVLLLLAAAFAVAGARAETRFETAARQRQAIAAAIVWPEHEPLMFLRRRGGNSEDFEQVYARQYAPENIQRMADAGVRIERLHFYKGFGLAMEMPEIRQSQEMAARMHAAGMKVSLYVAGTMFTETFYRELPDAVKWEQRDQNDQPVPYTGVQTYRHFACRNEPAYRDYIKRVVRIGVQDLKADEIFFDNVFEQPEPKSCCCPRCMAAFHEFLRRRYPTAEACLHRFGYPSTDYVRVPEWFDYNRPDQVKEIDDPALQEWVAFRCETLARYCGELYDYVKSLNPNVAVGFNLKGLYGSNRVWGNALYHPLFKGKMDFSPFDAGGFDARYDARTGALISEIRSYKMARDLGFSFQTGGNPLQFAVYMAFNPQTAVPAVGHEGGAFGFEAQRDFSPEVEFFRTYNDRYYTDTEGVADVAVLRTWPSMAYSISGTLAPMILMEQVLIQDHVPFDIIFDNDKDRISRYQAIVVPGQESLSADWVQRLRSFANAGGTVVFTGDTADYNEFREKRRTNPLRSVLTKQGGGVAVAKVGAGRFVYIASIVPHGAARLASGRASAGTDETNITTGGGGANLPPEAWILPQNHEEIRDAITRTLPHGLSIETAAPSTVVTELLNRPKTAETIAHFINFDTAKPAPAFAVTLKKQRPGRIKTVTVFSPDEDEPQAIRFEQSADAVTFTVPALRLYAMAVVAYE